MEARFKSAGASQHQEQGDAQMQFLMQNVLDGVLQQLERIERVVEGEHRTQPMKRSEEGDKNHVTAEDNFQALKTKLMAFSALHNSSRGKFQNSATDRVCEWIARRPSTKCSGEFAQALIDTLDACKGEYNPSVNPVELTEETLQDFAQRLAKATHVWHIKEAKFNKDPEAAANKAEMYKIRSNEESKCDAEEIRSALKESAKSFPGAGDHYHEGAQNEVCMVSDEGVDNSDSDPAHKNLIRKDQQGNSGKKKKTTFWGGVAIVGCAILITALILFL